MSLNPAFPAGPLPDDFYPVQFFSEELDFEVDNPDVLGNWIKSVVAKHNCDLEAIQVIFCSDAYLHKMNVDHLGHDYLTDIITFPYQPPPILEGDLFISVDRVRDNAQELGVSFDQELHRVIIHGVLHLCGFGDKTEDEAKEMRSMEDQALSILEI